MACCSDTKYDLILPATAKDDGTLVKRLGKAMSWSETQSEFAVKWLKSRGDFLLLREKIDKLTAISQILAENNIEHKLKLTK